jgi:hypothetical protein
MAQKHILKLLSIKHDYKDFEDILSLKHIMNAIKEKSLNNHASCNLWPWIYMYIKKKLQQSQCILKHRMEQAGTRHNGSLQYSGLKTWKPYCIFLRTKNKTHFQVIITYP